MFGLCEVKKRLKMHKRGKKMTQNAQKGQKNDQKSGLFNRREQKVYQAIRVSGSGYQGNRRTGSIARSVSRHLGSRRKRCFVSQEMAKNAQKGQKNDQKSAF